MKIIASKETRLLQIRVSFDNKTVKLRAAGAWLHDIYLVEAARGKGVSEPFFAAIIEAARSLGADSLMLSVSPHNGVARKFFERLGFRPTMQEMRLDFE